ncbi:PDZ domain-containing protein [Streptomyces sp. NPDC093510]|uniref:PDZ domain-containing protein n=1 Tax=Streptomyces sp. NPDC093510 TaxID=3155199 RepID=UPI00343BB24F
MLFSAVLLLTGIGLGTVSATVIGMGKLADMRDEMRKGMPGAAAPGAATAPGAGTAPGAATGPGAAPGTAKQPAPKPPAPPQKGGPRPPAAPARTATLGIEAVDATAGPGALLVGVHIPGPGHTAGLVRGDTLLAFGGTRVGSAAELASAVGAARPGKAVTLTVRHMGGGRQVLSVRPGVVT